MSAALIGGRLLTALSSLSSCSQRAPFILLCLVRFPGPNHLRVARLVHGASIKASLYFKRLSLKRFYQRARSPQPVYSSAETRLRQSTCLNENLPRPSSAR